MIQSTNKKRHLGIAQEFAGYLADYSSKNVYKGVRDKRERF